MKRSCFLFETQIFVKKQRTVDEGVSMEAAEAKELCIFETRDEPENPFLFRPFQPCLKSDHIKCGKGIVLRPELNDRIGFSSGMRVREADRLHGAKPQGVLTPGSHNLNRHAALEDALLLERFLRDAVRLDEFPVKPRISSFVIGQLR